MNGLVCGRPSPPSNEISFLECAALFEVGVVEAVDHHDVGDVLEPVRSPQVSGCVGGEQRKPVLALDPAVVEVVGAARADGHGAVLGRVHEQKADMGMSGERRDQVGVAFLGFLGAQPSLLLHQVDEAQVAGAKDDGVLAACPAPSLVSCSS